jgi:hypothetical protein
LIAALPARYAGRQSSTLAGARDMKQIRWLGGVLVLGLVAFLAGRSTGRGVNADLEPSQRSAEALVGFDKLVGPFDFTHGTVRDALTELARQSNGNLLIDWRALEDVELDRASLDVRTDSPARLGAVLNLVLLKIDHPKARVAYSVLDGGSAIISTETVLGDYYVVTRIYDIRDLIRTISGHGGGSSPGTTMESVDAIIKLIEDTITSDQWKDNGGNLGSIREFAGQLIVTHTRDGQRRISDFLRQLRETRNFKGTIP